MTLRTFRHKPLPEKRERLEFVATYTQAEFARMQAGYAAQDMEDKWDIGMEDGWLLFCRSWTGLCCFGVRFEEKGDAWMAADSWVSRAVDEYLGTDLDFDRDLLRRVIKVKLLADRTPRQDNAR